jgi:hypothetical protein
MECRKKIKAVVLLAVVGLAGCGGGGGGGEEQINSMSTAVAFEEQANATKDAPVSVGSFDRVQYEKLLRALRNTSSSPVSAAP